MLSKSLLLFSSIFFLFASLLMMGILLNFDAYNNRIVKIIIFTLYSLAAVSFYNINELDKAVKGLNKSLLSHYFWTIGFLGILATTVYSKNEEKLKENNTLKIIFWLTFFSSVIPIVYIFTNMIVNLKRFKSVKSEAKFLGRTVIKILIALIFLGLIAINIETFISKIKITKYSFFNFAYVIILYIPCFILDGIKFLNKEFKLASSDTKLMLIIQTILVILYFIYPRILRYIIFKDSVELLRKPKYLNTEYEIGSTKQLEKKYNRKFQPDLFLSELYKGKISFKTLKYLNPFKTIKKSKLRYSEETQNAGLHADILDKQYNELAWDISFAKIENNLNLNITDMEEYLDKLDNDRKSLANKYYALKTKDTKGEYDKNILVNKNYTLSFWLNVNPIGNSYRYSINKYSNVINYGNKIIVEYLGKNGIEENILRFLVKSNNSNELIEIHKEENLKLQKWNYIVINYSGSIIDIFLNGILITSINDITIEDSYNLIKVGEKNGISGSICGVRFFYETIKIDKIKGIYKLFKNNNPPVI